MVPAISSVALGVRSARRRPLACYHRKAASMLAGARGFDGRLQCQQVGLLADVPDDGNDDGNDLADLLGTGGRTRSNVSDRREYLFRHRQSRRKLDRSWPETSGVSENSHPIAVFRGGPETQAVFGTGAGSGFPCSAVATCRDSAGSRGSELTRGTSRRRLIVCNSQ
jgi:hypothetical protein